MICKQISCCKSSPIFVTLKRDEKITMAKKASRKIKKPRKKTGEYYLKLTVLALVSSLVAFNAGNHFMKQQGPCANSQSCQSDLTQQIDNNATGTFEGHTITPPKIDLANALPNSVLGDSTNAGDKHIYVDLTTQKLYAYQGDTKFMETYISSGKWDPTPVGNFHIWEKLVATRMKGGSGADAYDLPNVPYVMYFYQDF